MVIRYVSIFLAVCSLVFSSCSIQARPSLKDARASVYQVLLTHPEKGNAYGSAVLIAPNYLLTAGHVVVATATPDVVANVKDRNGRKVPFTVIKHEPKYDLALIYAEGLQCPCAPISKKEIELDEEVVSIGFPIPPVTGGRQTAIIGTYQGIGLSELPKGEEGPRLHHSAHSVPGVSGGGVFVVENGKWVLQGINDKVASFTFAFSMQLITYISEAVGQPLITEFLQGTPVESYTK